MSDTRRMDVIKRDDTDFELTFKDVDGNPIDITGATVFFTVKINKTDADDDAVITKEIDDFEEPETGVALLSLTKDDTDIPVKAYYFDVQLKDSQEKIMSSYAGRFIVLQDVTIRTDIS